jgi:hypothetical protein
MNEVFEFQSFLAKSGMVGYSYSDAQYLLNAARICARQAGIPLAGLGATYLASVGAVSVPVVGALPGWVAGGLAGFFGGTAACVLARASMKPYLDEILRNR